MKSLKDYILEQLIDEGIYNLYYKPKMQSNPKFNFKLESHGHSGERDMVRSISNYEVKILFMDCWERIKKGIESGKILINKRNTKLKGSSFALHSSEKTESGYLTIVCFVKNYNKENNYYTVEVITTWKGKNMESFKEKDKNGKTMYHPEYGQLDFWDNFGLSHYDKKDDI